MAFEENGDRINDLKLILGRVAEVSTMFDEDGILIRFMNSGLQGNGIRDAASAANLVAQVQFNGMTPLGTALDQKVMLPTLPVCFVQNASPSFPWGACLTGI